MMDSLQFGLLITVVIFLSPLWLYFVTRLISAAFFRSRKQNGSFDQED